LWTILWKFSKINSRNVSTGHVTKKIWKIGSTDQRHESGILNHACTEENVTTVDEPVGLLNQKGQKLTQFNMLDIQLNGYNAV